MKYKALMLDVDGTLVPYDYGALPSVKVVKAVQQAQKQVTVCLVSGRSYGFIKPVLDRLNLHSGYVVLNNGAQVLSLTDMNLLYDQPIDLADAQFIADVLFSATIPFYLKQEVFGLSYQKSPFRQTDEIQKAYMFFTDDTYTSEQLDSVLKKLSFLTSVSIYKAQHKEPGKFGLNIVHANATKLHGVSIVMEKLQLRKEEIIGVGDSYNDFPLLMTSGLKVAMGNAVEELKSVADFVAPSVENDGVAEVIQRFVL